MSYIIAGLFNLIFLWQAGRIINLYARGKRTTGIITDFIKSDDGESISYRPVIRYYTTDGQELVTTSNYGSEEAASFFRINQQVDIIYLLHKPHIMLIVGYDTGGLFLFFLLAVAAIAVTYGMENQ